MSHRLLLWFITMDPANRLRIQRNRLVDFLNVLLLVRIFCGFSSFRERGSASWLAWLDMESVSDASFASCLPGVSLTFSFSREVAFLSAFVGGERTTPGWLGTNEQSVVNIPFAPSFSRSSSITRLIDGGSSIGSPSFPSGSFASGFFSSSDGYPLRR